MNEFATYPQLDIRVSATLLCFGASSKSATYPQPRPAVSATLNGMRRMTISLMTAAINTMRTNINTTTKLIDRRNSYMTKRVYMQ